MKTSTAQKIQVERTTKDVVYRRIAQANKLIVRLIAVGLAVGVVRVLGVAFLMSQCTCHKNIWLGQDLHNKDGELFNGKGTLAACGNRLCTFCAADIRRRARKQARLAVSRIKANIVEIELEMRKKLKKIAIESKEEKRKEIEKRLVRNYLDLRWRFVTLTAPKVSGRSLLEIIGVYNRAFGLLRRRNFFESWIAGGIKGVEFTIGEDLAMLDIEEVEKGVYHVHIHLMIFAEWLPWQQLQEEWTKCITTAWKEVGHDLEINTPSGNVLTRISLVVPKARKGRQGVMSEDAAIEEVVKYVTKSASWLKIPEKHLVECATVKRWPRMFELFGCAREKKEKQDKLEKEPPTILDTPNLKIAENLNVAEKKKKPRAKPMLDWLEYMPFEIWVGRVSKKLDKRRAYRKQMLAERYPGASFMTLDGEMFGAAIEINAINDE